MEKTLLQIKNFLSRPWVRIIFVFGTLLVSATIFMERTKPIDPGNANDLSPARLKSAADYGDIGAQLLLGEMYQIGFSGIPQDQAKALAYYIMAAKAGSPEGAYNAALLLSNKGDKEAIPYLWLAYNKGIKETRPILGAYLVQAGRVSEGEGVLFQAAQDGDAAAMMHLARYSADGILTKSSMEETLFWGSLSTRFERDPVKSMTQKSQVQAWLKNASEEDVYRAETRARFWSAGFQSR